MHDRPNLPPGQRLHNEFPRFGVTRFAQRLPRTPDPLAIRISGDIAQECVVSEEWTQLPRTTVTADFHCVTTWSYRSLEWSGVRFRDVFEHVIKPTLRPDKELAWVILRCRDGYRTLLPLSDMLRPDVLLADVLNGKPLTLDHGAPVRLVAPAHYGYKNAKHLNRIELRVSVDDYTWVGPKFMDHPRARVALEERGRYMPGWVYRYLYRPMIKPTIAKFKQMSGADTQRDSSYNAAEE